MALCTTMVMGAIAEYTMKDIREIIEDHQEQAVRSVRGRNSRREFEGFKL